jgi:exodeoxyribonuclease V alpha subunit
VLTPLDEHVARTLVRLSGESRPEVALAVALVSNQVGEGHVCLDVREVAGAPFAADGGEPLPCDWRGPAFEPWMEALAASPLVASNGGAPLVLEGHRLYLRRYHEYETALARRIRERIGHGGARVDRALLREGLRRLFPASRQNPDWQRVAATLAVQRRFTVISGGPGTGKTWTVARILALLVEQGLHLDGRPPPLHLLAPTGKAAARLRESIRDGRMDLPVAESVRAAIPEDAATIHRALGIGRDGGYLHGPDRRLVADAVIVDEASMVDLALMNALLAALPDDTRVILLGDRDQLASVEAGSVLGDICGAASDSFSPGTSAAVRETSGDDLGEGAENAPPICDSIVRLVESRRFRDRPGIGAVAEAIRAADAPRVLEALASGAFSEVSLEPPSGPLTRRLATLAAEGYGPCLAVVDPVGRLAALGRFRILCAHRHGTGGVESVNRLVETTLADQGRIDLSYPWYVHRPILVTRNDPGTRLYNGDVGIVVRDGQAKKALFPSAERGSARLLALSRMPAHETAFAITVHKSQGSEFDHVVVVLPEKGSPVLTRELLYTAVTRARDRVTILGDPALVELAVRTPTRRTSGLGDRLWGGERPGLS